MEKGKGSECGNKIMYMSWPPKPGDIGNTGLEFVLLPLTWERGYINFKQHIPYTPQLD
jgi:hypothetical protein